MRRRPDYATRRGELRAAHRPGNLARILAVKLETEEFTRLFEVLDRPELAEAFADEIARIEEERNPEELAPRRKGAASPPRSSCPSYPKEKFG